MNLHAFGKATDESLEEIEAVLGFKLPDDYKKFLSEYNGGTAIVRYSKFFVKELNQEVALDVLYGIDVKKSFDLSEWYEEFAEDLLPNSLIIGNDPGSGIIVLITDTENHGVYYWDHSFYFPQSTVEGNTYKIASNFNDFINGLKKP